MHFTRRGGSTVGTGRSPPPHDFSGDPLLKREREIKRKKKEEEKRSMRKSGQGHATIIIHVGICSFKT